VVVCLTIVISQDSLAFVVSDQHKGPSYSAEKVRGQSSEEATNAFLLQNSNKTMKTVSIIE
jgi:hypothetical protein